MSALFEVMIKQESVGLLKLYIFKLSKKTTQKKWNTDNISKNK